MHKENSGAGSARVPSERLFPVNLAVSEIDVSCCGGAAEELELGGGPRDSVQPMSSDEPREAPVAGAPQGAQAGITQRRPPAAREEAPPDEAGGGDKPEAHASFALPSAEHAPHDRHSPTNGTSRIASLRHLPSVKLSTFIVEKRSGLMIVASKVMIVFLGYALLLAFIGPKHMLPSNDDEEDGGGEGWCVCLIWVTSMFFGNMLEQVQGGLGILGMLLSGILLKNLPTDPIKGMPDSWSAVRAKRRRARAVARTHPLFTLTPPPPPIRRARALARRRSARAGCAASSCARGSRWTSPRSAASARPP